MLWVGFNTNLIESINSESITCNLELLAHTITCKRKRKKDNIEHGTEFHKNGNKKYEGQLKNGIPHGQGIYYYEKGNKYYEGQFENGNSHGHGTYYHEYKINIRTHEKLEEQGYKYYEGDVVNGKKHGFGKLYDKFNGRLTYEGEFENGKVHGKGKEYNINGKVYSGQYVNNLRHGLGITYDFSGEIESMGEFYCDLLNGQGKTYFRGNFLRTGEFKAGKLNGQGKEYYISGRLKYEGEWKAGIIHGKGTYYIDNETNDVSYSGSFENGSNIIIKNANKKNLGDNKKCSICQSDFNPRPSLYFLPCGHIFHKRCLKTWFKHKEFENENKSCPLCRADNIVIDKSSFNTELHNFIVSNL